jgi:hypothetical protein
MSNGAVCSSKGCNHRIGQHYYDASTKKLGCKDAVAKTTDENITLNL